MWTTELIEEAHEILDEMIHEIEMEDFWDWPSM